MCPMTFMKSTVVLPIASYNDETTKKTYNINILYIIIIYILDLVPNRSILDSFFFGSNLKYVISVIGIYE